MANGKLKLVGGCIVASALRKLGYSRGFKLAQAGNLEGAINAVANGKVNAMTVYGDFWVYGIMDSAMPKKSITIFDQSFGP
jgi:ABC-type phosphate/phosphonate transport system substrate-binding protein